MDTYSIVRPILGNSSFTIDNQIKIYPNPFSDVLNISLSNQILDSAFAEIIDINGRVLQKVSILSVNSTLATSDLAKGIYIVRISNAGIVTNQKIIKN